MEISPFTTYSLLNRQYYERYLKISEGEDTVSVNWRRVAGTLTLCLGMTVGLTSVSAEENVGKKTLQEAFDQSVIVPYDYQGKAFVNGVKTDLWGEYEKYSGKDESWCRFG